MMSESFVSKPGDVAATMYAQAPNTNFANMLAGSGYMNRYGNQLPPGMSQMVQQLVAPQADLSGAYQDLVGRQADAYRYQAPSPVTTPSNNYNFGGK